MKEEKLNCKNEGDKGPCCACRKGYGHVGAASDDALSVSGDERRTVSPQSNPRCGAWGPVELVTSVAVPVSIPAPHSTLRGVSRSQRTMALCGSFTVGKANDLFCTH